MSEKLVAYLISTFLVMIIGSIFLGSCLVNIEPGFEGVLIDMAAGGVQEPALTPGLNFKTPITQSIVPMDARITTINDVTSCSSKDLQNVTTNVTVKYKPKAGKTPWIFNNIGPDYANIVIKPDVTDAIKATTAHYNVEDLIVQRETVRLEMQALLTEKLLPYNIVVDGVDIVNFDPSPEYSAAIEAKQVAQQKVQQSAYEYDKAMIDANITIAGAQAAAESIKIKGKALKENPGITQLEAVNKWNGVMPLYYGGGNNAIMFPAPTSAN